MTFLRLPFEFDVVSLKTSLQETPDEAWRLSNSAYVVHGSYLEGELIEPRPGEFDSDGVPVFDFKRFVPEKSYFRQVRNYFQCVLESFRVTRLKAGGEIRPHRDFMYGFEHGLMRVHIPVITNGGSEIHFESDETVLMNDGECWYGNFAITHHLKNNSERDRYHLVLDCRVNDWCQQLMSDARTP